MGNLTPGPSPQERGAKAAQSQAFVCNRPAPLSPRRGVGGEVPRKGTPTEH